METFSAFQVAYGPSVVAWRGSPARLPPPEVRAFCTRVTGCRSTTRVLSSRYSAGEGGASWYLPCLFGGSLKAQCLISPCPPCITTQRTSSHAFLYSPK